MGPPFLAFVFNLNISPYTQRFLFFFRFRFIVARRVFLLMGILYLMRCITMYITVLPVASYTYKCSPPAKNPNALMYLKRMWQLLTGFGLSINGKHTYCGDFIYSGHTLILVLTSLIITECECFLIAIIIRDLFKIFNQFSSSALAQSESLTSFEEWGASRHHQSSYILFLLALPLFVICFTEFKSFLQTTSQTLCFFF